uniref:Uncharacterized protein n=1 Tax=Maylandia zebra TaxID=106582 RepID=A0A3P9CJS7_9CICH
ADQEEEKSLTEQQRKFQLLGLSSERRLWSRPTERRIGRQEAPGSHNKMLRVRLDPTWQTNPSFLGHTLADLELKERVVWVDNKKTHPRGTAVGSNCRDVVRWQSIRVKAQMPGDKQLQEVLYSTEVHTDRSFCCTGMDILPWKQTCAGLEAV